MSYYQITLNQGRTDTVVLESDSIVNIKSFFLALSTANITSIKKIIFSKALGIGSVNTTYSLNNDNKYLDVMLKSDSGLVTVINIQHPLKNLSNSEIIKSIKKNLLIDNSKILEIVNIVVKT